jgi:hypothetical protein
MALRRDEIIPTYRVPALVRAPGDQVDPIGIEPTCPPRGQEGALGLGAPGVGGTCQCANQALLEADPLAIV